MVQAAKIIGTGLATTGLIGAAVLMIIVFIVLCTVFPELFYVYCGDSLEEYYDMINKISRAEGKVKYFSDQLEECSRLLQEALDNNESKEVKEDIMEARKDSETNLSIEKKVLETLKSRLQRRDFDVDLSTGSSLGKRRHGE